jgi:hypothetical protein
VVEVGLEIARRFCGSVIGVPQQGHPQPAVGSQIQSSR